MLEELAKIREEVMKKLESIETEAELTELNVNILGRSGALTSILRGMSKLGPEERAALGKEANEVKQDLVAAFDEAADSIEFYPAGEGPFVWSRPMGIEPFEAGW